MLFRSVSQSRYVTVTIGGLDYGGKEAVAIRLAKAALASGWRSALLTYDSGFRSRDLDFDPQPLEVIHLFRTPGFDIRFGLRLRRAVSLWKPDVVHAHGETAHVYSGFLFRPRRGPAVISTFHTRFVGGRRGGRAVSQLVSRFIARRFVASHELRDELVATKWLHQCDALLNGVDLDRFTPDGPRMNLRERFGIPAGHLVIGHVARYAEIKRHVDLVAAAQLLKRMGVDATFVCVGNGPLRNDIERAAAGLSNIHFLSAVDPVETFLRGVDAIVLCSRHEVMPLTILEALACGKPVIATAVGGIPSLVGDGDQSCGILVSPGKPEQLASAIQQLSTDRARLADLAMRTRQRAGTFDAATEWSGYERAYRSAVASVGGRIA